MSANDGNHDQRRLNASRQQNHAASGPHRALRGFNRRGASLAHPFLLDDHVVVQAAQRHSDHSGLGRPAAFHARQLLDPPDADPLSAQYAQYAGRRLIERRLAGLLMFAGGLCLRQISLSRAQSALYARAWHGHDPGQRPVGAQLPRSWRNSAGSTPCSP